ncbi:protein SPMIP1-like [Gastrophryne carolinensis]
MARELNLTTQKQEFLKQCYLKENLTRVNWHRQYRQNLAAVTNKKLKMSNSKVKDCFKLPSISNVSSHVQIHREEAKEARNQDKSPNKEETSDIMTNPVMRPVSSRTRSLLYSGTSREEEGRQRYMKKRNKLRPEDKYSFPLVSSWDYGWQIAQKPTYINFMLNPAFLVNEKDYYRLDVIELHILK